MILRWIFRRLDTTPGQEDSIRSALRDLDEAIRDARSEWRQSVRQLIWSFREDKLDDDALGEGWKQQDSALGRLRAEIETFMATLHSILDSRQRERLADMIASAPFCRPSHGV